MAVTVVNNVNVDDRSYHKIHLNRGCIVATHHILDYRQNIQDHRRRAALRMVLGILY